MNEQTNETPFALEAFEGAADKLAALRPLLMALLPSEVRLFNLSVPSTLSSAIRIWHSYTVDKALFDRTFTAEGFDASGIVDFPMRTAALWYANVLLGQALGPRHGMPDAIIGEAKPLHAKLAKAALYLWESDSLLGPVVLDIRQGAGHLDMAGDLTRYAVLFTDNWDKVENRCDVTAEELQSAKTVSTRMLEALTATPIGEIEVLKDQRNRAGEYLRRGADEIRAAAEYVFRKDPDALLRYPSLHKTKFAARGKNKADDNADSETENVATEPSVQN